MDFSARTPTLGEALGIITAGWILLSIIVLSGCSDYGPSSKFQVREDRGEAARAQQVLAAHLQAQKHYYRTHGQFSADCRELQSYDRRWGTYVADQIPEDLSTEEDGCVLKTDSDGKGFKYTVRVLLMGTNNYQDFSIEMRGDTVKRTCAAARRYGCRDGLWKPGSSGPVPPADS